MQTSRENRREELQAELDAAKTGKERNRLGQFGTPYELAAEMLSYAKGLLPSGAQISFLDPGFGTGAFYSALLQTFHSDRITRAEGFEIDPHYYHPTADLWKDTPLKIHRNRNSGDTILNSAFRSLSVHPSIQCPVLYGFGDVG